MQGVTPVKSVEPSLRAEEAPPHRPEAGALRRAGSGQAWRGWVQEVAKNRRQVKAAVHRARPAPWVRHKAHDGSIHAEPTGWPGAPERVSPPCRLWSRLDLNTSHVAEPQ